MRLGNPIEVELCMSVLGKNVIVSEDVDLVGFHSLFIAQRTLLLEALKVIQEHHDPYKRYELLKSCKSEYEAVKILLKCNQEEPIRDFKRFCEEQFIPLLDNHIERVEESLKIKNHKSYVRKNMGEKGLIKLDGLIDEDVLSDVFAFFETRCLDKEEYHALKQELRYGRLSLFEFYRLSGITTNTIPLFFKILRERYNLSISNRDLAKWIHRKFKVERAGKLSPINSERTIEDKLKGNLTNREKSLKLDRSFNS